MDLTDPTTDYCKKYAKIMTESIKRMNRFWYKFFRLMGHTAIDSLQMARQTTQVEFDKCDFTVNFDGPMA